MDEISFPDRVRTTMILFSIAVLVSLDTYSHQLPFTVSALLVALGGAFLLWLPRVSLTSADRLTPPPKLGKSGWNEETHPPLAALRDLLKRSFDAWDFNDSERQVARFLLLGYSNPDIIYRMRSNDRVIRKLLTSLFSKSQTYDRDGFIRYFLADLLRSFESRVN
jgi:hypothetical protein